MKRAAPPTWGPTMRANNLPLRSSIFFLVGKLVLWHCQRLEYCILSADQSALAVFLYLNVSTAFVLTGHSPTSVTQCTNQNQWPPYVPPYYCSSVFQIFQPFLSSWVSDTLLRLILHPWQAKGAKAPWVSGNCVRRGGSTSSTKPLLAVKNLSNTFMCSINTGMTCLSRPSKTS